MKYMRSIRILAVFMALVFTASSSWASGCEISCALQGFAGGICHGQKMERASGASHSGQHTGCGMQMHHGLGTLSASHQAAVVAAAVIAAAVIAPTNMGMPCPSGSAPAELKRAAPSPRMVFAAPVLAASSAPGSLSERDISVSQASKRQAPPPAYSALMCTLRI
jgi:hypothetical protein